MADKILPPMPPSDEGSLRINSKARDFWKLNEVVNEQIQPDRKCPHEFKVAPSGAKCTKCHFGLIGHIEVRKGKLFHKGKPINF